jgi:predicted deacylase
MFQSLVKNGAFVEKGEILAIVTDPYGNYEKKIKL